MTTPPGQKALEAIRSQADEKSGFKVPAVPTAKKKVKSKQIILPEEQYIAVSINATTNDCNRMNYGLIIEQLLADTRQDYPTRFLP